jgi:hypothetical protein
MRLSCYLVAKIPTEVLGNLLKVPLFFLEIQVSLVKVDDMLQVVILLMKLLPALTFALR